MRLLLPSLIPWLYVSCSLLRLLPASWPLRVLVSLAVLAASMKFLLYGQLGGSFLAPNLPAAALVLMEALYVAVILLFFLLLAHDLLTLACALARRLGMASCRMPFSGTARATAILLAAILLGGWSTWESVRVPNVHTVEVDLPNLPPALDGLSIVQLSDLHIRILLDREWLQTVVDRVNALEPDIIVLTGDYIDDTVRNLGAEMQPLGELKARHGIYGVTGNHEYYYGAREWTAFFEALGIHMLENSHADLNIEGNTLVIAGLPDLMSERFGGPAPQIAEALHQAPEAVRILLQHRPQGAWTNGADLQISGHTHGGSIFFLKPLVACFNEGFVCGLYRHGNMRLHVSPGTGIWGGFSCRLGVPAEITRLVLRATPQKTS